MASALARRMLGPRIAAVVAAGAFGSCVAAAASMQPPIALADAPPAAAPTGSAAAVRAPARDGGCRGRYFDDAELTAALPEREARQAHLLRYIRTIEPRLRAAMAHHDELALKDLREELASKQETILFGGLPAERQRYLQAYGCAKWTDDALAECARHGPLVEMGAGAGHWQRALSHPRQPAQADGAPSKSGASPCVDVIAYDDGSEVPLAVRAHRIGEVRLGGPPVLRGAECAGRALLLVYPPAGMMAAECLDAFRGETLLYVGEARGGYNADESFFRTLEAGWRLKRVCALEPYNGGFEKLYVLKRKHGWARRLLRGGA